MNKILEKYFDDNKIKTQFNKAISTQSKEEGSLFWNMTKEYFQELFRYYTNKTINFSEIKALIYKDIIEKFHSRINTNYSLVAKKIIDDAIDYYESIIILSNNNKTNPCTTLGRKIFENCTILEYIINSPVNLADEFLDTTKSEKYEWARLDIGGTTPITFKKIQQKLWDYLGDQNAGDTVYQLYKYQCNYVHCNPKAILKELPEFKGENTINTSDLLIHSVIFEILNKFDPLCLNLFIALMNWFDEMEEVFKKSNII